MKRKIIFMLIILISLSIPFYAMFIWEPDDEIDLLKSMFFSTKEAMSTDVVEDIEEIKIETEKVETNNNIENIIKKVKKEDMIKIKGIFNKISTVDQNKIFQLIEESKYDYEVSNSILELMFRRLGNEDAEELRGILQKYITIN